ncbi:hypothetical protein G9A89_021279, partial [Geosiphon pyriformis]
MAKVIGVIMTSHDELDQLKIFLQNEPLNKITVARAFHELWKCKDVQTEESDSNCLLEVFKELTAETLNSDRKEYFTSLQDIDKGEKCGIRKLRKGALIESVCVNYVTKRNEIQTRCKFVIAPSETTRHENWVEGEDDRAQIATNITDTLLQEIKRNVLHKISKASENALVDVVARLMEASIYQMPIGLDIE